MLTENPDTHLILNSIPLACYMLDNHANFVYINKKAESFFQKNAAEMMGKNVWKLFPKTKETDYFYQINDAIVNKKPNTFEYVSVYTQSWIKLTVVPLPKGIVVSFNCIEKDKRTENLYRTLVENTPDLVSKWDSKLKLSYCNVAFLNKTAFSSTELLGKTLNEIWPLNDISSLIEKANKVLENGELQHANLTVELKGVETFYDVKLVPDFSSDGKVKNIMAIGRDVTGLKRSQELFNAQLRNKYTSLFNSINQGFCIIEMIWGPNGDALDYKFIEVNPAFQKQTGIIAYEGRTMKEIAPKHEKHWFEIYGEIAKTKKSAHFELPAKDLVNGWYEVEAFPISELGDGILGILFNDITERKKAEALAHKNELRELEKKQQKQILKATLNAQEEERKRIAESLHNGLGQILYGLKTTLERIRLDQSHLFDENTRILQQSKELLDICIRESRKISHELMPSILEDFGLKAGIQDICKQLKGKTHFHCTFSGIDTHLDKYLQLAIYRIAQELSLNIIKHAAATIAYIDVTIKKGMVHITAKDNGKGFDNEKNPTEKGIGLKTIEQRIKLLQGNIEINSVPHRTIIHIQFPL